MLEDDTLLKVATDVAIRLKAHGQYKGEIRLAVKALQRRAPGFTEDKYENALDFLCRLYDEAVEAIARHPAKRVKQGRYAEFKDIDFEACMADLDIVEPGYALGAKREILG